MLNLGYKERTLLLACGAASGIAAVFNSPIAGLVFAIEVLLTDVSIGMFIPLLISTASAIIVSKFLYSGQLFYLITNQWYHCMLSRLHCPRRFMRACFRLYDQGNLLYGKTFENRKGIYSLKAIIGGLILGMASIFCFRRFSEGHTTITSLFRGRLYGFVGQKSVLIIYFRLHWVLIVVTIATVLDKGHCNIDHAWIRWQRRDICSIIIHRILDRVLDLLLHYQHHGNQHTSMSQISLAAGMAGIMSGVVHAPLYSHISHCRNHRWVRSLCPVNDRFSNFFFYQPVF